jgi:hypothetical protein
MVCFGVGFCEVSCANRGTALLFTKRTNMLPVLQNVLKTLKTRPLPPGETGDDDYLAHDWRVEKRYSELRFISKLQAPPPYSKTGEPVAALSMEVTEFLKKKLPLPEVIAAQIKVVRRDIAIGPYPEDDGRTPEDGIASYIELVGGREVGFLKYTTVGNKGNRPGVQRRVLHAIAIDDNKVYHFNLIVLVPEYQAQAEADQMRLIKGIA